MVLNPKWGMWISAVAAVLAFVAISTAQLTTIFSASVANEITAIAGFFAGAINAVNVVLHMIPSQSGAAGAAEFPLGPTATK